MLSNVTHAESIGRSGYGMWLAAALAATVALAALALGDAGSAPAVQRRPRVELRSPMCGEARASSRDRLERRIERAKERAQRALERAERRAAREAEHAEHATRVYLYR